MSIGAGRWRMSPKQKAVRQFCNVHGEITLEQAVELIGGDIYCNESKHVGAVLSNMVKKGLLARKKKGVYHIERPAPIEPNQQPLFTE